jgi:HAD superfamily hydrolase (TIGR01509 family)
MRIQAAIFDIGNVLVCFDWGRAAEQIRSMTGNDTKETREKFVVLKESFELGAISQETFLKNVIRVLDFRGGNDEFAAIWNGIFSPNTAMEDLIAQLKKSVPLFLLSNTSELHLAHLKDHFQVLQYFGDGVYSFRAGCAKPNRKIFEIATKQFGVVPFATIFVDDLEENVESAAACGFQAIRYDWKKHSDFRSKLAKFGFAL